jgi:hypothetical protein
MDENLIPNNEDRKKVQYLLGSYGAPAFVRRGRQVEEAYETLLAALRLEREKLLAMVRLRIGQAFALAGDPERLRPLLREPEQLDLLVELHRELHPTLRVAVEPTSSLRILRQGLRDLIDSLERFDRRWNAHLVGVDLIPINKLREGYNRHYVVEKECVVGSARLAREGFVRLPPLTVADLRREFPALAIPDLR